MRHLLTIFCLVLAACSPPVPDQVPPKVTEPDYSDLCDPDQNPQEKVELRYFWSSGTSLSKRAFTEACDYFKNLGITCIEVSKYFEANLAIKSDYEYFYCDQNAVIVEPYEWSMKYSLSINLSCLPQDSEAVDWQREVFAKQLGKLFGVTGYPAFCGAGNFANYVERPYFREPYDEGLSLSDQIAWYSRDRSLAFFGGKEPAPYCGPDVDTVPAICANPTDAGNSFVVNIYAAPEIWTETLFACNLWNPLGIVCLSSAQEDAFVTVARNLSDECDPPGETEYDFNRRQWIINISSCLDGPGIIRQIAHQLGHALGAPHIPPWCATAIMNPAPQADCLTWADYGVWPEKNPEYYKVYE